MPETITNKVLPFILPFLIIIFFITRLTNLSALPIYNDEAMYLNWGRLIVQNPKENLFISLTDGQQPFFIWLTALSYALGRNEFLYSGRLISILSGLGTMFVMYLIGKELVNKKTGMVMAGLYIILPFALWYDRLAIKDSWLQFLAVTLLYLALRNGRKKSFQLSLFAGIVLGMALLTKSIAYFFLALYPLTIGMVYLTTIKKVNLQACFKALQIYFLPLCVTFTIALTLNHVMSLSPLYHAIGPKNSVFLLSFQELVGLPFQLWRNNIYSIIRWHLEYYSIPLILIGLWGTYFSFKKNQLITLLFIVWLAIPITFEALTAKIFVPRYFLFTSQAVIFFIASGFSVLTKILRRRTYQFIVIVLFLIPILRLDWQILSDAPHAPLPAIDRWQYMEGWPAGYGVSNLADFLGYQYLKTNPRIVIYTEEETLVSSSLPLYLSQYKNLNIRREIKTKADGSLDCSGIEAESNPVNKAIIITHQNTHSLSGCNASLVTTIQASPRKTPFSVYELNFK